MTKFEIKFPNGTEINFEGDEEAFEKFKSFLAEGVPTFVEAVQSASPALAGRAGVSPQPSPFEGDSPEAVAPPTARIDIGRLNELIAVARSDVERVAVMAFAAVEFGLRGLDYATAEDWYRQLGLRRPGRMRSTFSNAATRGYIHSVGRGLWRPTPAGENLAVRGERRRAPQARPRRGAAAES